MAGYKGKAGKVVARQALGKVGWKACMNQEPFNLHTVFNQFEAGFWFLIALLLVLFYRRKLPRPWVWLLPVAFAVFGASDVIEVETGAWWRPWWLLVVKAACVGVFLVALRSHLRHVKAQKIDNHASS